jgi:hypothetical protein
MKTIIAVAAFAALVASPALAQDMYLQSQTQQPVQGVFAQAWQGGIGTVDAFASANVDNQLPRSNSGAWDVYDTSGEYIGSDPDPFIRNELARDPPGRGED